MSLPPAWKIKRELLAAQDQIKAWIFLLVAPLRQRSYDKRELTAIQIHDGERDLQKRLILYLIYQPHGLRESNFIAIEFLLSQGYEVLVVSNGKISNIDVQRLKPLCWRILERDNLGYDFGGYRCGLHYLKQQKIDLDAINLINDSIWFPIIADKDILSRLENIVSDFGGAVCLNDSNSKYGGLVLSYWVTVKKPLFQAQDFWNYWRKYLPTGNKTLTVKYGERGLSRQMNFAGREADGVFTTDKFLLAVQGANIQELRLTLKYGAFTDPDFEEECLRLFEKVEDTDQWRTSCLDFIDRVVRRRNFLHSFCYASIALLRVPFIKKNNLKLQFLMRKKYLHAVYEGDLPSPGPYILKEIESSINLSNQSTAFR